MSADFWSFAVAMAEDDAEATRRELSSYETVSDVVGPDEETLHRFDRHGDYADPSQVAAVYRATAAGPPREIGVAYVDAPFDVLEPIVAAPASSPNYPVLVVLDRAIALPHGIDLMGGRALRVLGCDAVATLERDLGKLEQALGERRIIDAAAGYLDRWGNGRDDAALGWKLLCSATSDALRGGRALLLLGVVVP